MSVAPGRVMPARRAPLELLPTERMRRIVELHREGLGETAIATRVGVCLAYVGRVLDMPAARFR